MKKKKLVGYARVSSKMQSLDLQIRQLKDFAEKEGAEIKIFSETLSVKANKNDERYPLSTLRPKLIDALNRAEEIGCMLVVTYLDRLARSQVIWNKICDKNVKILALFQDVNNATDIMINAEYENKLRSIKAKNALKTAKERISENRKEEFSPIFYEQGSPEYVVHYVLGVLYSYPMHKSPNWSEGDVQSAINTSWSDLGYGIDITLDEATNVAEDALAIISSKNSRRIASMVFPYEGWHWDEKEGMQIENTLN